MDASYVQDVLNKFLAILPSVDINMNLTAFSPLSKFF